MSTLPLTKTHQKNFQAFIYRYFHLFGRHQLPWRGQFDPYHVLVSEIMLQQTQVDRVIPKFTQFMATFPSIADLAQAPVSQVIMAWQGLGYNRRALKLQQAAQQIKAQHASQVPSSPTLLLELPGIGPYTAAAIQAFAFNQPALVLETNIRTVFIYHFFPTHYQVSDQQLLPLLEQTLDHSTPRDWYSALMDYGSFLKQQFPNPTRRSSSYVKQSPLAGSNRQARGLILKALSQHRRLNLEKLGIITTLPLSRLTPALEQLLGEGFISKHGHSFGLNKYLSK